MKYKTIDTSMIQVSIRNILVALGADPKCEGLKDTPYRVAKMFSEVFEGMLYTNEEICEKFNKCFEDDQINVKHKDLVILKDIPIFSFCEHHLALMYNMKVHVAYIPEKKIIGLSKIARVADMVARRLQLQERIGSDIAFCISKITGSKHVAVIVEGEHACMTTRGISKPGVKTKTSELLGDFMNDATLRSELYSLI